MNNRVTFSVHLRQWLGCWLKRWQSRPQQAALMASTHENITPPPEFNLTPQNWLAQQAPEDAIVVYISKPSLQIVELLALPRQKLIRVLNIPMHRDPAAKWKEHTSYCLRRIGFDPAIEFAAHADAMEDLEFLLSARSYLSTEMISLDLLITTLFAEVCPSLADAAQPENTADTSTTETYSEQETARHLATIAAKHDPNASDSAMFTARLVFTIRHARSEIKPTNRRELLAALLNERKLASVEMAQLDAKLLPAMRKLGLKHNVE